MSCEFIGEHGVGIPLTFFIFAFTIAIEYVANVPHDSPAGSTGLPLAEPAASTTPPNSASPARLPDSQGNGLPSPALVPSPSFRAQKFTKATTLFIVLCIMFIAQTVRLDLGQCEQDVNMVFVFFNVLPFVTASIGWARTLVDCLLVRWGKSLQYPTTQQWGWPPFLPLSFVVVIIMMLTQGLIGPVDTPKSSADGDVELAEEERGFLEDVDGVDDQDVNGPPAYDANWQPGMQREESESEARK
ncbi:hypothetical protein DM02DRAFT_626145 [Periconia macrospinosa]|uniref:Uncharacterized protein n=1 Tax=Periconia macrospinosa TaxID=97972 RepID=A0A2V1DY27_9PLEO|nr:hypothetical protein DM02DRAFT_626145 [Periconia macrospinosa]